MQEPVSLGLTVMQLQPGQCKWPHGTGPYLFCGHPASEGESYCQFHCARAYDRKREEYVVRKSSVLVAA